jgi:hypothetical protein
LSSRLAARAADGRDVVNAEPVYDAELVDETKPFYYQPRSGRFASWWLLKDTARVLEPGHPLNLTIRGNVANYLGMAGNASAAVAEFTVLSEAMRRVLGPDHPGTLTICPQWSLVRGACSRYVRFGLCRATLIGPNAPCRLHDA